MDLMFVGLTSATVLNLVFALINILYYRRVRRRHRAVLRAEQRLSSGPVTASLQERYG